MTQVKPKIVIIDDNVHEDDPLVVKLSEIYDDPVIINNPIEGAAYLEANFGERLILLLDIKFSAEEPTGHFVLDALRKKSYIVPVIVMSALDEDTVGMTDFINKRAFAFLKQTTSYDYVINKVKEAEIYLNATLGAAVEECLLSRYTEEERNKPAIALKNGKTYTLTQVLTEVRQRTELGLELEKDLIKLTIDLLVRGKEQL